MTPTQPIDDQARADALDGLLLAVQGALSIHEVQANYLDAVAAVVGASSYKFAHFDPFDERLTPLTAPTRMAPDGLVPAYDEIGADRDPLLIAAVAAQSPVDDTSMPERDWRADPVCGVLSRHGLYHSMVVPLVAEARVLGALYLARGSDERPFSDADRMAMLVAKRHTEKALHRAIRHEELDARASLLAWVLDELELPVLVTAPDGRQLFENKAVRRLRQAHQQGGPRLAELLSENLAELRRGARRVVAASGAFVAADGPGVEGLVRRLVVKSTMVRRAPGAVVSFAFVRREDGAAPVELAPLSAREREIVAWVAQGLTNRNIAELAFVSENTVRQHLKRIFGKLDVHNRAQLIQAVWQGADDLP